MASTDSTSLGWILLDRLRAWLRGKSQDAAGENEPRRRGLSIAICILFSLILWFTLSLRKVGRVTLPMQTVVQNLPDSLALTAQPTASVDVDVEGEASVLLGLYWRRSPLVLNAEEDVIDLRRAALDELSGVTVISVNPTSISLQKEERIHRKIPIRLRGRVAPAPTDGWLYEPRLTPDSVVVSGARSIVASLDYWPTVPFERKGVRDSLVAVVPLADTLEGLIRSVDPTETTLIAVARPFTEGTRTIKVMVTGVPSMEPVVSLEPSSVNVRYQVPLSQYEKVRSAPDFFATVSYEVIRADTTGRIQPQMNYPEGVVLRQVQIYPTTLRYYIRLEQ